jgi:hypothetical protein
MMSTGVEINPVWSLYCGRGIESWLEWLRNIEIDPYLELSDRFIKLNPHYIPIRGDLSSSVGQTFERLMVDEDFIHSLSDEGLLIWANSGAKDFLVALSLYSSYMEIRRVLQFLSKHLNWFERTYAYLRADIIANLREAGRNV